MDNGVIQLFTPNCQYFSVFFSPRIIYADIVLSLARSSSFTFRKLLQQKTQSHETKNCQLVSLEKYLKSVMISIDLQCSINWCYLPLKGNMKKLPLNSNKKSSVKFDYYHLEWVCFRTFQSNKFIPLIVTKL